MKKLFTLLALVAMVVMPMSVKAESTMTYTCTAKLGEENVQVCTVSVTTTGDPATELAVKMTAVNATINQNSIEAGSGWVAETGTFPTVTFTNSELGATGTYNLFTFEYTRGTNGEVCTVTLEAADSAITITDNADTTTENKQTGAALPYVFLGGALLIAGYAFVSTKNKSKMYKI